MQRHLNKLWPAQQWNQKQYRHVTWAVLWGCVFGSSKGRRCSEGESEPGAEGDMQAGKGGNLMTRGLFHNTPKGQARQVNSPGHQTRAWWWDRSDVKPGSKVLGQDQQGYKARRKRGCNLPHVGTKHKSLSLNTAPKRWRQGGKHLASSNFLLDSCKASRHCGQKPLEARSASRLDVCII